MFFLGSGSLCEDLAFFVEVQMEKIGMMITILSIVIAGGALVYVFKNINSQTRRNLLFCGWLSILASTVTVAGAYRSGIDIDFLSIFMFCIPMLFGVVSLCLGYRTSRAT